LLVTPDSPAALDSLGWVRLRRGDSHDAAGILEHAYNVGQDPDIAAHWVEALWNSGSQAQARQVLNDALTRHPESAVLEATRQRLVPSSGHR
jgi:cytochrome c-type biogenesis protein CcmH/NrfG